MHEQFLLYNEGTLEHCYCAKAQTRSEGDGVYKHCHELETEMNFTHQRERERQDGLLSLVWTLCEDRNVGTSNESLAKGLSAYIGGIASLYA